VKGILGDLVS